MPNLRGIDVARLLIWNPEPYQFITVDLKALLAGNDVLLFSQDVPKAIEIIKKAIKENKITQNEIDLRCHKILMAKKWLGLNKYKNADLSIIKEEIISRETKSLDSELILSSLTLLKNDDDIFNRSSSHHIFGEILFLLKLPFSLNIETRLKWG